MINMPTKYSYEEGTTRVRLLAIISEAGFTHPNLTREIKDESYVCPHQKLPAKILVDKRARTLEVKFEDGATDIDKENVLYDITYQLKLSGISESGRDAYEQYMNSLPPREIGLVAIEEARARHDLKIVQIMTGVRV